MITIRATFFYGFAVFLIRLLNVISPDQLFVSGAPCVVIRDFSFGLSPFFLFMFYFYHSFSFHSSLFSGMI